MALLLRIESLLDMCLQGKASMNNDAIESANNIEEKGMYKQFITVESGNNNCTLCSQKMSTPLYSCKGTSLKCSQTHANICNYCFFQHIENDSDRSGLGTLWTGNKCRLCVRKQGTFYLLKGVVRCFNCSVLNKEGADLHIYNT